MIDNIDQLKRTCLNNLRLGRLSITLDLLNEKDYLFEYSNSNTVNLLSARLVRTNKAMMQGTCTREDHDRIIANIQKAILNFFDESAIDLLPLPNEPEMVQNGITLKQIKDVLRSIKCPIDDKINYREAIDLLSDFF